MAIPIVWGTRVKETAAGTIAVNCPYCGELSIADCFNVGKAVHFYYIHGKFQNAGSYIKCRVCANPQEMPADAAPVPLETESEIRPRADFVRKTNPGMAEAAHVPIPLEVSLPPSVSRTEWAIVQGISVEIARQSADDKVEGNIKPLYLLTLMGAAGGFIAIWLEYERGSKLIPLMLIGMVSCMLFLLIRRFHIFLLNRALHREMANYVRRNLAHSGNNIESLVAAARVLGKDYRAVAAYLDWARRRIRSESNLSMC